MNTLLPLVDITLTHWIVVTVCIVHLLALYTVYHPSHYVYVNGKYWVDSKLYKHLRDNMAIKQPKLWYPCVQIGWKGRYIFLRLPSIES